MGEVAAWTEAPARAIGRFDVRTPLKSFDEMLACTEIPQGKWTPNMSPR